MFLSIILTGYAVAALVVTQMMSAQEKPHSLQVFLSDSSNPFVTEQEVRMNALGALPENFRSLPADSINLQKVEDALNAIDNIEEANVTRTYKGDKTSIRVDVSAMIPVARVFDRDQSYYINRQGKRLTANYRYKVDVPVVVAHFTRNVPPTYIIPFVDYLHSDSRFNSLVSAVGVEPDGDIIIYPMVTNARINFGDTTLIKDKVQRIMIAYNKIMRKRGWDYYDTISVKFDNQIVAHRRYGPPVYHSQFQDADDDHGQVDFNYMDTIQIEPTP